MNINMIRSDKVYRELLEMPMAERRSRFKKEILAPYKEKLALCQL